MYIVTPNTLATHYSHTGSAGFGRLSAEPRVVKLVGVRKRSSSKLDSRTQVSTGTDNQITYLEATLLPLQMYFDHPGKAGMGLSCGVVIMSALALQMKYRSINTAPRQGYYIFPILITQKYCT